MSVTAHVRNERQHEFCHMFPKQDEQVHSTVLDGESVLLNLSSGRYYTLNVVGSFVWDLCKGEHSLEEILSIACDRFDVAAQQAQDDIWELIMQLEQEELLHTERR